MFEFGKSLPASKLRVVGRGGSGSKLRQVSVSKPIVVLEADNIAQRQPVDHGGSFYRPTGRGGLGSLSTSSPTALKPLKPPSAILDRFLRGRKPKEGRPHSVHLIEGPSASMSQDIHPEHASDKDSIMEERQTSKSPIFDDLSIADKLLGLTRRTHHKWDSFESDSLSSPMTFAPPSLENAPHSKQTPTGTPASDAADSNCTTTSREDHSTQSHCSAESSTSPMPHLHVSTPLDSVSNSTSESDSVDVPPDPNDTVGKSDWLVPLNEVVISIRRTAPSKPQSWTGEWNREMRDVIRDLRRL
jgi:hypothetical protein